MILDLSFERIDEASVLSGFYCGILSMDVFIHEKLQEYLNQTDCIVSQVEKKVQRDNPECEFQTVEAYKTFGYSAVGFYLKCSFTPAETPLGYKDTLRMYKVLRPKTE